MKTKFAYRAICATCYTCCVSGRSTSKADANRAATSHMNAYGHSVHIACEEIDRNPFMEEKPIDGVSTDMDHWKVRLTRPRRSMTILFSMGKGHNGAEPTAADVLDCLASDASSVDTNSFEDWCADLGYDVDSRKAERTYRECKRQAEKLSHFLGGQLMTTLLYHVTR